MLCSFQGYSKVNQLCVYPPFFPGNSAWKESTCNAGDPSSIPGSGRSPGEGIFSKNTSSPVFLGFPGVSGSKKSTCNVGNLGSVPGLGRSPGGGHGNPLQYSCLENPHGQRSLAGYSPWGHKELDTTERLSTAQPLSTILLPYRSLQSIEYSALIRRFLLIIYFIYKSVYMSIPVSQFVPLSPFSIW